MGRGTADGPDDAGCPGDLGQGRRGVPGLRRAARRRGVAGRPLPVGGRRPLAAVPHPVPGDRVVPARRGHARDERRRERVAGGLAAVAGSPDDRHGRAPAAVGARAGRPRPGRPERVLRAPRPRPGLVALGPRLRRGPRAGEGAGRGDHRSGAAVRPGRRPPARRRRRPRVRQRGARRRPRARPDGPPRRSARTPDPPAGPARAQRRRRPSRRTRRPTAPNRYLYG